MLENLSDDELRNELKRRTEQRQQEEIADRNARHRLILDNITAIIESQRHERTSCSDENPCNAGRCNKCSLISFKKENYIDPDYIVKVTISHWPIKDIQ